MAMACARRWGSFVGLFVGLVWAATGSARAAAPNYTFTKIADTRGSLTALGLPSLNEGGVMAFWAAREDGSEGIFTGAGGELTTIADTTGPLKDFGTSLAGYEVAPSINDKGTVAFWAARDDGSEAIFTGAGGELHLVVEQTDVYTGFAPRVSLNNRGWVAVVATLATGGEEVFRQKGQRHIPIALAAPGSGFDSPLLNQHRMVVFSGASELQDPQGLQTLNLSDGTLVGRGGLLRIITCRLLVGQPSPAECTQVPYDFGPPALNDQGQVAYWRFLDGGESLVVSEGTTKVQIAGTFPYEPGPFPTPYVFASLSQWPAINTEATVAFTAQVERFPPSAGDFHTALYTVAAGIFTSVIRTGDVLDGVEVSDLGQFREALNDGGQIAFWAQLADGTAALYRADPIP